ncbi:hypothetical protein BFW90_10270 [Pseudomonas fluorescens]|nr:hypothetical protein BFW90_10270 [Pseudomonas fluorescens]
MPAKNVNDNAFMLDERVALGVFASKLAPTKFYLKTTTRSHPYESSSWFAFPVLRRCGGLGHELERPVAGR